MALSTQHIQAVSGLLKINCPLHFLSLALVALVAPLWQLIRVPVIEAVGARNWMVLVLTVIVVYFSIFIGFMVLALRDPLLVSIPDGPAGERRSDPQPAPALKQESCPA